MKRPLFALWHMSHLLLNSGPSGWKSRLRAYHEPQQPGLLSFITTVWNTEPRYLHALAKSVFTQQGGANFEWLILDNGTQDPASRAAMAKISKHPCVRFERVEENLGIIGGMRYCLERAAGRYVLPLDSDDLLSPDCVRVMTTMIVENGYPPLLYSDEDKLYAGLHVTPYCKPDWDPVLFMHSCYIAHLCAMDRKLALEFGCYTDPAAEGSHDWDSFTRFHLAGCSPVHVPEVIYSWRMHGNSTSSSTDAKPFVSASHHAVLGRFLSGAPQPELYTVVKNPLFGGGPNWRIRRSHSSADIPSLTTVILSPDRGSRAVKPLADEYPDHRVITVCRKDGLQGLLEAVQGAKGLIHLLSEEIRIGDPEWAWEALALMEVFPDIAIVGGRIADDAGRILSAGHYLGFGRGCGAPDRGQLIGDPGYWASIWTPHSVSAVSVQHAVFRADFLVQTLGRLTKQPNASFEYLGAWAGVAAQRQGLRTVYSPVLTGAGSHDWEGDVSDQEHADFLLANADLLPEQRFLSRHLGFNPDAPLRWTSPADRERHCSRLIEWAQSVRAG